jgi:putative pyruvate formate lyase activating enzyme
LFPVLLSGILVLPVILENTPAVLAWFAENLADKALLSLMFQYVPPGHVILEGEWMRTISSYEYEESLAMLDEFGIEDGFVQEPPETGMKDSSRLPDFSLPDAFPGGLAHSLWFYGGGRQG